MSIKSILFLFGFLMITNVFAGQEDWNGTFTINDGSNSSNIVKHTPSGVSYLFFKVGECLHLSKGTHINGVEIKEDINLCRDSNVTTFKGEVGKLGRILNQTINLGPTYSD